MIQWLASLNAGQTLNVPDPNALLVDVRKLRLTNTIQGVKNAMDRDCQDVLKPSSKDERCPVSA